LAGPTFSRLAARSTVGSIVAGEIWPEEIKANMKAASRTLTAKELGGETTSAYTTLGAVRSTAVEG
jgi:hypothetical protein